MNTHEQTIEPNEMNIQCTKYEAVTCYFNVRRFYALMKCKLFIPKLSAQHSIWLITYPSVNQISWPPKLWLFMNFGKKEGGGLSSPYLFISKFAFEIRLVDRNENRQSVLCMYMIVVRCCCCCCFFYAKCKIRSYGNAWCFLRFCFMGTNGKQTIIIITNYAFYFPFSIHQSCNFWFLHVFNITGD